MSLEAFGLGYTKYKYYKVLEYFIDWYIQDNNYNEQDEAYHWIKNLNFTKTPTQEGLIINYLHQCRDLIPEEAKKLFNTYNAKKTTYINRIDKQRKEKAKPPWFDFPGRKDTRMLAKFVKLAKENNQIISFDIPIRSEFACGLNILENWKFYTVEECKLRPKNHFEPYIESQLAESPKAIKIEFDKATKAFTERLNYLEKEKAALEKECQDEKKHRSILAKKYYNLEEDFKITKSNLKDEKLRFNLLNSQLISLEKEKQNLQIELKKSLQINQQYQESTTKSQELLAKLEEQERLIKQMREVLKLLAGNVIESLVEGGSDPDEFIQMTKDIKRGKIVESKLGKIAGDKSIVKQDETAEKEAAFPTFRRFLNIVTQLLKNNG